MTETKGKISLSGFNLEKAEKAIVDKILKTHTHKIREKIGYKEIYLDMKKSKKSKTFLHEIKGRLITPEKRMTKTRFEAGARGYNLFSVLDDVLTKLRKEAEHKKRKAKHMK